MTEKTDNSASQIDLDKIDQRFNKIDERFNKIDKDLSDLRLDMRHQANQNRVLYALSLALYGSLVIALILIIKSA